jgi:hypothetical protein
MVRFSSKPRVSFARREAWFSGIAVRSY